jgi:hypothetical protein
VPLVTYAAVSRAYRHGRLDEAADHAARHGGSRRAAAFGVVFATALRAAAVASGLAVLGVTAAHAGLDRAFLGDVVTSAWIAALGGLAYTALFSFGSLFGRRGGGRAVCLAIDWALGMGGTLISVVSPRAHLRSLAGGEVVMGLTGWESTLSLYFLAFACIALCLARVAR